MSVDITEIMYVVDNGECEMTEVTVNGWTMVY